MRALIVIARVAGAAASAALLGACAQTPYLDSQFGASQRLTRAQQMLNPQAGRNTAPVLGMDGAAAKSAYDNYQRSFATPDQQTSFTIGSGGVTSR